MTKNNPAPTASYAPDGTRLTDCCMRPAFVCDRCGRREPESRRNGSPGFENACGDCYESWDTELEVTLAMGRRTTDPEVAGVVTFASPELDGELSSGDDGGTANRKGRTQ
mgnify:CR=1 FL=1